MFTLNFVWAIFSMSTCELISGYFVCSVRLIHGLQHMHIDTHEIVMYDTFYLHSLQTKLHTAVEIDMCRSLGCCSQNGLQDQSSETVGHVNSHSMPLLSAPHVFSQSQASPSTLGLPLGINKLVCHHLAVSTGLAC